MSTHLLLQIQENFSNYSTVNQKIAKFILDEPKAFVALSGKEISERIGVSPASVTRFCKLFGLNNFFDLKLALSGEVVSLESILENDIDYDTFRGDIAQQLCVQATMTIQETCKQLSANDVFQAAQLLHHAPRILCTGIGASDLVAQDLTQKLLRLEKNVSIFSDLDLRKVALLQFTPQDVLVAISYSGEKKETCALATIAKKRNVKIISITKSAPNPLAEMADVSLPVVAYENIYRTSAVSSRIAQLYVVDTLFYTYGLHFQKQRFEKFKRTYEVVNPTSESKQSSTF